MEPAEGDYDDGDERHDDAEGMAGEHVACRSEGPHLGCWLRRWCEAFAQLRKQMGTEVARASGTEQHGGAPDCSDKGHEYRVPAKGFRHGWAASSHVGTPIMTHQTTCAVRSIIGGRHAAQGSANDNVIVLPSVHRIGFVEALDYLPDTSRGAFGDAARERINAQTRAIVLGARHARRHRTKPAGMAQLQQRRAMARDEEAHAIPRKAKRGAQARAHKEQYGMRASDRLVYCKQP